MNQTNRGGWSQAVETSALLVGLIFLVELLKWVLPFSLNGFGIVPRTVPGLIGVVCSPLLHLDAKHLMANAVPLFVLLVLLFGDRGYHPEWTLVLIWIVSGFGTWLIGRDGTVHIGASSIIYGLVVYLIASGWWMGNWRSILVAVLVLFFYGGIFYGVLPQRGLVSWEGHLAGAIAGWWAARRNHG
jgi:membrane associated rhomboid family serine protease